MSRIVIDARELRTSTGRYIERHLEYLQQTKSEHEYLVLLKAKDMDGWQPSSQQFKKIECPYKEFTFSEQIGFYFQIMKLKADLVHFGMTQQPIMYRGRTVTTIHDLTALRFTNPAKNIFIFKFKQFIYKYVTLIVAKKSLRIFTPTQFVKDDVASFAGISPDKIVVTYEAADKLADTSTPLPHLQNKKFIMYVGRPTPHKNLERLIDAFVLLKAQHPDIKLVLAGKKDTNYSRIEESVVDRGIKNILFTDFVTDEELSWLYKNCEAYVFPSLSEGFGLPGLEAMLHGAPVVSSDSTCLPELYKDAAHYFNPKDTQEMSDAINEVLTNKGLRENLIKLGYTQAAKYSWARMARQTLDEYNKTLV